MEKLDIVKEWFNIADKDLSSAEFLQNMKPEPIEIICYHCQQSAEKYIKGFIAYQEHEIVKTHDLMVLNNICKKIDESFQSIENECLYLTDFGINIRYPYRMDLNESDLRLALRYALKIQHFIIEKVKF